MKTLFIILSIGLFISSCSLITEPNIDNSEVILYAPAGGLETTARTHTFWWEYVPDAEGYNLVIVSPQWNYVEALVLDTNITSNKFTVTLNPGEYEWGISAYNYSSSTKYSVASLTIDTSSSLSNQKVVLLEPSENITNDTNIKFKWNLIDIATKYTFLIKKDTWEGGAEVASRSDNTDTISLELDEGIYVWGVNASNDHSITPDYTQRNLIVDRTPPGKPIITMPSFHGETLESDNQIISWNRQGESLSAITDSIFIGIDSLFAPKNDPDIFITTNTQIDLTGFEPGTYFTKVRSFDAAGNVGISSVVRKFIIDEK